MAKVTMDYSGRMTIGGKVFNFTSGVPFTCEDTEAKVFEAEVARRNQLIHKKREVEKRKAEEAKARAQG